MAGSDIGRRVAARRREKGYTQEQLAQFFGITGQAVSKWETGHGLPDTAILPDLARILNVSIDRLLTGTEAAVCSPYDREYEKEEYYWGEQPSLLACQTVALDQSENPRKRLLDIGSGEGRDAFFFARSGYWVDALEISLPGIQKIKKYSDANSLELTTLHENLIGFQPEGMYDVIYSMGALQFLPPTQRCDHFDNYKIHTVSGGLNAHMVFVDKPFIVLAPDWQKNEFFFRSGELAGYYHDWEILLSGEMIIDCMSADLPHRHAVCYLVARKIV